MGLKYNNELVPILLYADDVVLLANNEDDLQLMLNRVHDWCSGWRVELNGRKTQVVHFRNKSVPCTSTSFTCGVLELAISSHYKYLGIVFNEHFDMAFTAKAVAQSASHALGLIISKCKAAGGFPYREFTKLCESVVRPVMEYGSSIFGQQQFTCIKACSLVQPCLQFIYGCGKVYPCSCRPR